MLSDYIDQLRYFSEYRNHVNCLKNKKEYEAEIGFEKFEEDLYLDGFKKDYKLERFVSKNEEKTTRNIVRWVYEKMLFSKYQEGTINYKNSTDMLIYAKNNKVKLNCFCHAYILRDALQSVGIMTRMVYCLPINCEYFCNHVVVEYKDNSRCRWVLVDPTYNVFFSDDEGNLLNLIEFRQSIIRGEKIKLINNNRFRKEGEMTENDTIAYMNMIVPALVVLQYESVHAGCTSCCRLISDKYLLPNPQMCTDEIRYTYYCDDLYPEWRSNG